MAGNVDHEVKDCLVGAGDTEVTEPILEMLPEKGVKEITTFPSFCTPVF